MEPGEREEIGSGQEHLLAQLGPKKLGSTVAQ